jgi:hypothetical protein
MRPPQSGFVQVGQRLPMFSDGGSLTRNAHTVDVPAAMTLKS